MDGDNFLGLEDQIKNLKESDPYLFEEDKKGTGTISGLEGGGSFGSSKNDEENSLGAMLGKAQASEIEQNKTIDQFF